MLTVNEVAQHLKVHPMTVYRWVEQGVLPASKLGTVIRVSEEDLTQFIESQKVAREPADGGKGTP